jgi:hypothetical protein
LGFLASRLPFCSPLAMSVPPPDFSAMQLLSYARCDIRPLILGNGAEMTITALGQIRQVNYLPETIRSE